MNPTVRAQLTRRGRFGVAVVAALIIVGLSPGAASAGQVDNEGEEGVLVQFSCGVACGSWVGVNGGESIVLQNVDGYVQAGVAVNPDSNDTPWVCEVGDPVPLAADEHLSLAFDWGTKDAGGEDAAGKATFTWASEGDGPKIDVTHGAEERGGNGTWCWPGGPN